MVLIFAMSMWKPERLWIEKILTVVKIESKR